MLPTQYTSNAIPTAAYSHLRKYCEEVAYTSSEADYPGQEPTGMVHELDLNSDIVNYFQRRFKTQGAPHCLYRAYINMFAPREYGLFHKDSETEGLTLIYYPTSEYGPDEGGATEIMEPDSVIHGYLPLPNRQVIFDSRKLHRPTPFKSFKRYTLALKYEPRQ